MTPRPTETKMLLHLALWVAVTALAIGLGGGCGKECGPRVVFLGRRREAMMLFVDARTKSKSISQSWTRSTSITPPPTRTETPSDTSSPTRSVPLTPTRTVPYTFTETYTLDPGPCDATISVLPMTVENVLLQKVQGAPDRAFGTSLRFYSVSALDVASVGFTANVVLNEGGVFFLNGPPESMITLSVKSTLAFNGFPEDSKIAALGPRLSLEERADLESDESHGLNRFLLKERTGSPSSSLLARSNMDDGAQLIRALVTFAGAKVERYARRFTFAIAPIPTYRLARDEFWFIGLRSNASVPTGCAARTPIVVQVTAWQMSALASVTQVLCLVAMGLGIAGATMEVIPTSVHAGMIAVLAELHFAQEDGGKLPLAINPTQLALGDTKYRYLLGATVANTGLVVFFHVATGLGIVCLTRFAGYTDTAAQSACKSPRFVGAFHLHLFAQSIYAVGRVFGWTTLVSYVVAATCLVAWLLSALVVHRSSVSSQIPFDAEFVADAQPGLNPLSPDVATNAKVHNTILSSLTLDFKNDRKGYWRCTDDYKTFVLRHGIVFEHLTPRGRYWSIIEMCDMLGTSLLTLFDNYTTFLAFYQFILTFSLKLAVIVLLVLLKPLISRYSSALLMIVYACELVATLALAVGSTRKELLPATSFMQHLALLIASVAVTVDCVLSIVRSVVRCQQALREEKAFAIDEVTAALAIPLTEAFDRAPPAPKTQEEIRLYNIRSHLRLLDFELTQDREMKVAMQTTMVRDPTACAKMEAGLRRRLCERRRAFLESEEHRAGLEGVPWPIPSRSEFNLELRNSRFGRYAPGGIDQHRGRVSSSSISLATDADDELPDTQSDSWNLLLDLDPAHPEDAELLRSLREHRRHHRRYKRGTVSETAAVNESNDDSASDDDDDTGRVFGIGRRDDEGRIVDEALSPAQKAWLELKRKQRAAAKEQRRLQRGGAMTHHKGRPGGSAPSASDAGGDDGVHDDFHAALFTAPMPVLEPEVVAPTNPPPRVVDTAVVDTVEARLIRKADAFDLDLPTPDEDFDSDGQAVDEYHPTFLHTLRGMVRLRKVKARRAAAVAAHRSPPKRVPTAALPTGEPRPLLPFFQEGDGGSRRTDRDALPVFLHDARGNAASPNFRPPPTRPPATTITTTEAARYAELLDDLRTSGGVRSRTEFFPPERVRRLSETDFLAV